MSSANKGACGNTAGKGKAQSTAHNTVPKDRRDCKSEWTGRLVRAALRQSRARTGKQTKETQCNRLAAACRQTNLERNGSMSQFIGAWKQSPETSRPQAENPHVHAYHISRVISVWKRSLEISRLQAEVTNVQNYNMLQLLGIWKRSGEISRLSERTTQTPLGMTNLAPGDRAQRKSETGL